MSAQRSLAEQLRAFRVAADLTLEGLADRSGVSVRTLSDIERGVSLAPQIRTVDAIARGLSLSDEDTALVRKLARARRRQTTDGSRASAVAPHRVADFTGRDREIAEVLSLLEPPVPQSAAPVVVISGPPGVGKTTSAFEAMSRADAQTPVLWVDLDGFSANPLTPLQVLRRLLRQMPGIEEKVPAELDEAVQLWRAATADNPPAVLLDNAATESQIRPVLTANPRARIVVTSRRSLSGLESVHRITLGPLSQEESVAFLGRLIPAAQRGAGDLRELAQLCDHIPLALRIAGNRIASGPARQTSDFIARMRSRDNRLRLLVAGDLAVEAAFALSYDELEPQTSQLFRSVSIIDGATFDARIAAAITQMDLLDTEDRLDQLTELGLVEARGGNRYRVHDLVRLFASMRLKLDVGEAGIAELRATLMFWLLATLERAGSWFEPERTPEQIGAAGASFPDDETAQSWIRFEGVHWWPAMQSAAAAGEHALVVDVADALHWFSELWADWGHWFEFFSLAVSSARSLGDKRLEAMHLGYVVWASWIEKVDGTETLEIARQALSAAEASGDQIQLGWANFYLGVTLKRANRNDEGVPFAHDSITAFRDAGYQDGAFQAMLLLAQFHDLIGDHESAVRDFQTVLNQSESSRSTTHKLVQMVTELLAYQSLSRSYTALARHGEAIQAATRGIALARGFGTGSRTASALRFRAIAHLAAGDLDAAENDIADALTELATYGDDPFVLAGKTRSSLEKMSVDLIARRQLL